MSSDELANLLKGAESGCLFVQKAMPPEFCQVAIQLLGAFRFESMNVVDSGIVGPARRGAMASVNILDIVIQVLQAVKQGNETGSFGALSDTCKRLQERKRLLGLLGRFIHPTRAIVMNANVVAQKILEG